MYILGINAFHGDSSAALVKDGHLVCAIEEERLRRVKHWAGFPSQSIKFCLDTAQISIYDIDYIVLSRDTKVNLYHKIVYTLRNRLSYKTIKDRLINASHVKSTKKHIADIFQIKESSISAKLYNIEHHRSHLSSSFFVSEFKKSAILSIDGFGDFTSTMTGVGNDNNMKILDSIRYPYSIGVFYTAVTQFLGFNNYGDEYKLMGLSSYGNPIYLNDFRKIIYTTNDGFFKLNRKYFKHFTNGIAMQWDDGLPMINSIFTSQWKKLFGNPRDPKEKITQRHIDLASSAQKLTEEIVFHILNHLYKKTNLKNLCIAGGVAQNSVLNGKILSNTPFENLYVSPCAHDGGTSIGAAFYLYHQIFKNKRSFNMQHSFYGVRYDEPNIINILNDRKIDYVILNDDLLFDKVSKKIIDGGVVGWFQGKSEFGPRALGNRSILMDPRRNDAKEILNKKIKIREDFRPFAPSIIKEFVSDYFVENQLSPFMERVLNIKDEKKHIIPAVTHIDGTGRLQTVDKIQHSRFHSLISKFYELTGIPILLNTSFNENEPIVNTPAEALDCYLRTKMDMLVIENVIIERSTNE